MDMELYVGTKLVNAKPMTLGEYNEFRGWDIPLNETGADEGYLVEYRDGGKPNVDEYIGYVSWSPKDVFELAYHNSGHMTFGAALELLQIDTMVARIGWNGPNQYLFYVPSDEGEGGHITLAHIMIVTISGSSVPWHPSQTDVLAKDWCIVA